MWLHQGPLAPSVFVRVRTAGKEVSDGRVSWFFLVSGLDEAARMSGACHFTIKADWSGAQSLP